LAPSSERSDQRGDSIENLGDHPAALPARWRRDQGRVIDVLPDTPGLSERWGKTIAACPYCHGFEIGGGSIGVLGTGAMSVHQASLIADWGDVTFFTNGNVVLDDAGRSMLERRAVRIEPVSVSTIEGSAPAIVGVRLSDERLVPVKALFLAAPIRMGSGLRNSWAAHSMRRRSVQFSVPTCGRRPPFLASMPPAMQRACNGASRSHRRTAFPPQSASINR